MPTPKDLQTMLDEIVRRLNEHGRRLRVLEERNRAIESKLDSAEDMILRNAENARLKTEELLGALGKMDARVMKIESDVSKIARDMGKTVKKNEVLELENLMSLYNPLRSSFVTRDELERILKEKKEG
ncbi:MAG: hypothetical protein KKB25_03935 [Nanoarchaeota archaeon]|nr:hypothetical protein [Nanoarchaeota archaeon]